MTTVGRSPGILLDLHLIGQMRASFPEGRSVLPVGRKTRALLAIVALMAPRPALRARLAELLWSRRPEEQARASLRQELHRLMEALAPHGEAILHVTRDHVALRPGVAWIDVAEVLSASVSKPSALTLLDGDLLEGLEGLDPAFDMWLATERERLRDWGRTVAEKLLFGELAPEDAIVAAQRLLQIDRAHEGAWRALMRAHAARGERGMAIQAYDRCRTALADLLDAAPSVETQRLAVEIRGPSGRKPTAAEPVIEPVAPGPARGGTHIGVLPLTAVGGDPADPGPALGVSEELSAALSRFHWLFIVAPASLARYGGANRDDRAIGRVFGLNYLLEGTLHRVKDRSRASLRLLDLHRPGQIVWAGRFDSAAQNRLDVDEQIAGEAAAQIEMAVLSAEGRQALSERVADLGAYATTLRAACLMQRPEQAAMHEAGSLLALTMKKDPEMAPAYGWRAFWRSFMALQGWSDPALETPQAAAQLADTAVQLDPSDARVLAAAGYLRATVLHELDEANALQDRALSLNPHMAMGWNLSAATLAFRGDLDEAEKRARKHRQLAPAGPWLPCLYPVLSLVAFLRRDFVAAADQARTVAQVSSLSRSASLIWLAALGHLGRRDHLSVVRTRLNAIDPAFSLTRYEAQLPLRRPADRDSFLEGLRRAGVT